MYQAGTGYHWLSDRYHPWMNPAAAAFFVLPRQLYNMQDVHLRRWMKNMHKMAVNCLRLKQKKRLSFFEV